MNFVFQKFFNMNISHQHFDYKIAFVNSQHKNTNFKGDFFLKNRFEMYVLKISGIEKYILLPENQFEIYVVMLIALFFELQLTQLS